MRGPGSLGVEGDKDQWAMVQASEWGLARIKRCGMIMFSGDSQRLEVKDE